MNEYGNTFGFNSVIGHNLFQSITLQYISLMVADEILAIVRLPSREAAVSKFLAFFSYFLVQAKK